MKYFNVITVIVFGFLVCFCNAYASDEVLEPITNAAQLKVAMDAIHFDHDSEVLSQKAQEFLDKSTEIMKNDTDIKILIEGYCDENGSEEYNLELGYKRAKEAMSYMIKNGIPSARLSIVSHGKKKPVATGHDETAWSKNRRVEFVILSE